MPPVMITWVTPTAMMPITETCSIMITRRCSFSRKLCLTRIQPSSSKVSASPMSILMVLIGLALTFELLGWILVRQSFLLNEQRLVIMILQVSVIGIIAVGVTQVIITGGIDLSSGSVVAVTAMVAASLAQSSDAVRAVYPSLTDLPVLVPVMAGLAGRAPDRGLHDRGDAVGIGRDRHLGACRVRSGGHGGDVRARRHCGSRDRWRIAFGRHRAHHRHGHRHPDPGCGDLGIHLPENRRVLPGDRQRGHHRRGRDRRSVSAPGGRQARLTAASAPHSGGPARSRAERSVEADNPAAS